ncbi:M14 family metallocarboxypeptidase [Shewanella sp. A32]|uniref:N-acetyl-ornithine deacetylase n=1 Tax=Shewanella sp. A32 TaxID=3031327 RepID=UPI0023BA0127|nr:M14 family metallocarboxypeptidase [Shewanella sp. A32]MDF0533144.1 M14 family metallocarboxypeptidase [Shewanella sp. A32]
MNSRTPYQTFRWHSEIFDCYSNDIEQFERQLLQETARLQLKPRVIGHIDGWPLQLWQSPAANAGLPSVLISSGFHGEEAAGPWGMLHFMSELTDTIFTQINLTLLPLANPTGFSKGHRFNRFGENPNRGYLSVGDGATPSVEGKLLLAHAQLLLAASRDGILTCHEDILSQQTYLYAFEPSKQPGAFSQGLLAALTQYFPVTEAAVIDDCPVENGIIFNHFDSSFEAWLVRSGAKAGACSETPAKANFDRRILANSAVMQQFIAGYHN